MMDQSQDGAMEEESASPPIENGEAEEESDNEIEGLDIDTDAFLIQIESKLRTTFSSLDLSKAIVSPNTNTLSTNSSSSSSNVITPSQFIQILSNCLHRMTKPIQLRCLMALLGLDPDVGQLHANGKDGKKVNDSFHKHVMKLLTKAQEEDDKWVRVLASIVEGKLFLPSSIEGKDAGSSSTSNGNNSGNDVMPIRSRSKETDQMIRRSCDGIITSIQQASEEAYALFREKQDILAPDSDDEEGEAKAELILDSIQLGIDAKPQFAPWCYRLGGKALIEKAIPELVEKVDFCVNEDADILHEDERAEKKKAEEERKEMEEKEKFRLLAEERKKKLIASKAVNGPRQQNRLRPGIGTTKKQPTKPDTASFLVRSKMKTSRTVDTRAGPSGLRGPVGLGRGRGRMAGLGRGAAANAIGGKSLATPISRAALRARGGRSQALLNSRRPGGITGLGAKSALTGRTATSALANGGRSVSRTKTKMKMIDVTEVEGLKKEEEERNIKLSEEQIRNNKKRKIREDAAAKGLTKKKWGSDTTETPAGSDPNLDASMPDSKRIKQDPDHSAIVPTSNFHDTSHGALEGSMLNGSIASAPLSYDSQGMMTSNRHFETQQNESQVQQNLFEASYNNPLSSQQFGLHNNADFEPNPVHLNQAVNFQPMPLASPPEQNWQQLLEKSNKLSTDNRRRVELFFVDKVNPTPDIPICKMKLHQEESIDPNTSQIVKETLYLELDYTTFGFKKLRKIKKK
jgi:hypothetical protein